jgi:hypothetical protein
MMPTSLRRFAYAGVVATLAGCAPFPEAFPELPRLTVATKFGIKNLCRLGVSPAISVTNPPSGATLYTVQMTNIDVLYQQPWQETLPAQGGSIPEGAAPSYAAPCPGDLQIHRYRFEVLALDSDRRPLAYGQTTIATGSLNVLVRKTRGGQTGTPTEPAATPFPALSTPPDFVFTGERDALPESMGPLRY